ncbi:MAG: sulfur carrier protein ThiS [Pseudomonadota bacterium]
MTDQTHALRLTVNGEAQAVAATTLKALLDELGYSEKRVATAVNGAFVRVGLRSETQLQPGDAVDIVAPMQGG